MERKLLKYIWRHSKSQQLWIFVIVLAAMPVYFLMLQLPKLIVNGPIQGAGFDTPEATQPFLALDLPFGELLTGQSITLFNGFELDRLMMLIMLAVCFLVAVFANGYFKLYINTFKGQLGEKLLRRLRYELFDRVLRYPVAKVRRVKPSEISSVIKDEVEPLGLFFGDAFSIPVFLGAQAITGMTFLFLQNTLFGVITLGIVLFQAWLIPLLRRRLLELGRQRQAAARRLSGRIGEYVQGMDDVHLHDASNRARSQIWEMLRGILAIRFELYQRKFFVKFINNFLIQFLAFLFYLLGGYLVITGRMDLGALVASIAAYKDLPAPIKGIIDWDQQRLMNQIRYEQAVDDFASTKVFPNSRQHVEDQPPGKITKGFDLHGISVLDSSDQPVFESITNSIAHNEAVAIVGGTDSGAEQVAEVLARLLDVQAGKVLLDDNELEHLPESQTGRRIGYADSSTYFAGGTFKSVLAETLPFEGDPVPIISDLSSSADFRKFETRITVKRNAKDPTLNIDTEPAASWPDAEIWPRLQLVMKSAGLYNDVLEYGMLRRLGTMEEESIRESLLDARRDFANDTSNVQLNGAVEFFDPDKYSLQLTVGENLIFGTPMNETFEPENLPANPLMRTILDEAGLLAELFNMGLEIATNNVELFGDLTEDSLLLQRSGGPSAEKLSAMKLAVDRLSGTSAADASDEDITAMLALTLDYSEAQARFGLLDEALQERLLKVREKIRETLEAQGNNAVAFLDPEHFNSSLTVLDNILFGRIDPRRIGARDRVMRAIKALLDARGISETVFRVGLSFELGIGGSNLSNGQAQKLKVARALLKGPDILVLNRVLSALDSEERLGIIRDILAMGYDGTARDMGVICVPLDSDQLDQFDRVVLMDNGHITADDTPDKVAGRLEAADG